MFQSSTLQIVKNIYLSKYGYRVFSAHPLPHFFQNPPPRSVQIFPSVVMEANGNEWSYRLAQYPHLTSTIFLLHRSKNVVDMKWKMFRLGPTYFI